MDHLLSKELYFIGHSCALAVTGLWQVLVECASVMLPTLFSEIPGGRYTFKTKSSV